MESKKVEEFFNSQLSFVKLEIIKVSYKVSEGKIKVPFAERLLLKMEESMRIIEECYDCYCNNVEEICKVPSSFQILKERSEEALQDFEVYLYYLLHHQES